MPDPLAPTPRDTMRPAIPKQFDLVDSMVRVTCDRLSFLMNDRHATAGDNQGLGSR